MSRPSNAQRERYQALDLIEESLERLRRIWRKSAAIPASALKKIEAAEVLLRTAIDRIEEAQHE